MVRTFQGQESPDPGIPCVLISDDAGRRVHAALDQGPKKNMLRHDPIDVISLSDGGLIKATKKKGEYALRTRQSCWIWMGLDPYKSMKCSQPKQKKEDQIKMKFSNTFESCYTYLDPKYPWKLVKFQKSGLLTPLF